MKLSKKDLNPFLARNYLRLWAEVFLTWAMILLSIFIWSYFENFLAFVFAFLVIGTRHHALNNLVHEASHFLVARRKWLNDLLSDFFFAGPQFISTEEYRKKHLLHHSNLGHPQFDSEIKARYIISHGRFIPSLLKFLIGFAALHTLKTYAAPGDHASATIGRRLFFGVLTNILVFLYCLACGVPLAWLYLWILPLITITSALASLRVIAEHQPIEYSKNGVENYTNELTPSLTRTIPTNILERFVFAPFNFCYHNEHHLYPSIPYNQLANFHTALKASGYYDKFPERLESSYSVVINKLRKAN